MPAVKATSISVGKCFTSISVVICPSSVGRKRPSSFSTYFLSWMTERMAA